MRVLVIGSEGFIGKALVRRLRAGAPIGPKGERAEMLTRLDLRLEPCGAAQGLTTELGVAGDICDRSVLEPAVADGMDIVFHLASVPGGAAERNFELGLKVNLESTVNLLEVSSCGLFAARLRRWVFAAASRHRCTPADQRHAVDILERFDSGIECRPQRSVPG